MKFRLVAAGGQPLYAQLVQQVRLAVETGVLADGDQMPGIRTLAEELVISHNTVAKAYTELERLGMVELRQGSGAFVTAKRRVRSRAELLRAAQDRVREVVAALREDGLDDEELARIFEAELAARRRSA